jgi:hypothetical protein
MEKNKIEGGPHSHQPALGATGNSLHDAASIYFDQGIGVFLTDPVTGKGHDGHGEYDPITSMTDLRDSCFRHQDANLAVIVDTEDYNFLAIEISPNRHFPNLPEPLDQLDMNDTLAFEYPDGTRYHLFRGSGNDLSIKDLGIKVIQYCDPLLVAPSVIDGRPVKKVSSTDRIANVQEWLESIKDPKEPLTQLPPKTDQNPPPVENEKEEEAEPLCIADPSITPAVSSTTDPESKKNSMDCFISERLNSGYTKEATYEAVLTYGQQIGWEEPANKILNRVISIASEIIANATGLDYIYAYIQELAYFLMYLFVDEHDQPHVFQKDMGKVLPMADKAVVRYLGYHYLNIKGSMVKAKYIKDTIEMLDVKLRYEGEKITLSNRVAWKDGHIFFDMGNVNSIKISKTGWDIERSPVLFRRFGHQDIQLKPEPGGDVWKLFDYLNVEEEDRLLLMVYIISLFVPDIAHPLLHVWGEHGSAKSFLCTTINQICDPTSVTKLIANRKDLDLVQNLYKHYVTVYDNLSEISQQMSDIFCQACTGGTFNKRRLYTDSEDVVFRIKHAVILNSIEMVLMRQDLIDRSIILHLKRIPPTRRLQEAQVWKGFEDDKSAILGGIMDCLSRAMEIHATLPPMELPRMADFYQWGHAITQALGRDGEDFVKAYADNIAQQNASVRHNNTLCEAVIELMDDRELHESTVNVTLGKLKEIAEPKSTDTTFPKAAKDVVTHLKQIEPTLMEYGVTFEVGRRQGRGTPLTIRKDPRFASSGSPDSPEVWDCGEVSVAGVPSEADAAVFDSEELGWETDDLFEETGTGGGM